MWWASRSRHDVCIDSASAKGAPNGQPRRSTDDDVEHDVDQIALRTELRELDERLVELRGQLDDLREDMRDYDDSPTATSLLLEQEALIAALEERRLALLEQLREG
jgi:hypothetical protein